MAAGIISLSFLYLQGGTWSDAITTIIAGSIALGLLLSDQLSKTLNIRKLLLVKNYKKA